MNQFDRIVNNCARVLLVCFAIAGMSSCQNKIEYRLLWSPQLYEPKEYESACDRLFDVRSETFELDSFKNNIAGFKRQPIFKYCTDNKGLISYFGSNNHNTYPYYIGQLKSDKSRKLSLFILNYSPNMQASYQTKGYAFYKWESKFVIFQCLDTTEEAEGMSIKPYFRDGYLLIWKEKDAGYDLADDLRTKEIEVQYCILNCVHDDVKVVPQYKARNLVSNGFFKDIPLLQQVRD